MSNAVKRIDILTLGVRRQLDELRDHKDLKREICACGQAYTRFNECPVCYMARLRKEAGL